MAHSSWASPLVDDLIRAPLLLSLSSCLLPLKSKSPDSCCQSMEVKNLLKDKKFWFASFLIVWAAALQGHMMWLQQQDSFKQKFGNLDDDNNKDTQSHDFD